MQTRLARDLRFIIRLRMVLSVAAASASSMFVEETADQGRPQRDAIFGIDEEMSVMAECRQHVIFGIAACGNEGAVHPLCYFRPEIAIVFGIDPEHRDARGAAEFGRRGDEFIRSAIVV